MKLNTLFNLPGSVSNRKRVGRGTGSGVGKTCGRGEKGQKSRSGVAIKTEGGQMPLIKRLPKRGFNSRSRVSYTPISLDLIFHLANEKKIDINKEINKEVLCSLGLIKSTSVLVKLLSGTQKFTNAVKFNLDSYSKSAQAIVEKAKGSVL
ncbi:MAG: hypothetical protein DGJ47_000512 [Rickettsiaceae bacterium]